MNKKRLELINSKIDNSILAFRVFDEPRPDYISKVTVVDKILDKTILWAIPTFVRPNFLTVFRFVLTPFVIFLFLEQSYVLSFILFSIAALSDAIDGALARTRHQITDWGIVFDPFADKLLIGSVGGILIFNFINPVLSILIIFFELVLIVSAYFRFRGKIVPAKLSGKIKMVLQCFGVGFIFIYILTGNEIFLVIATYILYLAVFFALLSIMVYKSI